MITILVPWTVILWFINNTQHLRSKNFLNQTRKSKSKPSISRKAWIWEQLMQQSRGNWLKRSLTWALAFCVLIAHHKTLKGIYGLPWRSTVDFKQNKMVPRISKANCNKARKTFKEKLQKGYDSLDNDTSKSIPEASKASRLAYFTSQYHYLRKHRVTQANCCMQLNKNEEKMILDLIKRYNSEENTARVSKWYPVTVSDGLQSSIYWKM